MKLSDNLYQKYIALKPIIESRLEDFSNVRKDDYFYEMCFCICTPQSKAANALQVQNKLSQLRFKENENFDPTYILTDKNHYIRFHNQKAARLLKIKEDWNDIFSLLESEINKYEKRNQLHERVNGFGLKEASHYLRNIGYTELAILDRHILKNLVVCGVFEELPNIGTPKRYLNIEKKFLEFAEHINIPIDHLDLLFWANEAGEIIK